MTWRDVHDPEANLDELIEGYFADVRILAAEVAAQKARRRGEPEMPIPEGYDGRLLDWLTEMLLYGPADGPIRAWPIVLALIERAPDTHTLIFIGSGELEDLVRKAGAEFEDRVLERAGHDLRFRIALSAVWQNESVPAALVAAIEAARRQPIEEVAARGELGHEDPRQ
ncbi:MAG: hypothetical protein U0838_14680 [Chloroflexota bacterium]